MPEDYKQANENLDLVQDKFELANKDEIAINKGKIHTDADGSFFKYKVTPALKIKDVLKGDIDSTINNTKFELEFNEKFKDDNVEIIVKVNGNLAVFNSESGQGNINCRVEANTKF